MTTAQRLAEIANHAPLFAPWTGPFDLADLQHLLTVEFGSPNPLDEPQTNRRLLVPKTILHIVSGNTPHAAFQTLLRGLILGAHNRLKLPSAGLPDFEAALSKLSPALASLIETSPTLPPDWLATAEVLVLYGTDATIETLRAQAPPHTRIIAHGQRLSIGLILEDPQTAAPLAAIDICSFDQRGCLSIHDLYLHPDCPTTPAQFAPLLAAAIADHLQQHPPTPLTPSEAGAITTLRETARFLSASQPDTTQLWESPGNTDWTILYEADPAIKVSCLNRTIYLKPWPADPALLGPELRHLACLALHPYDPALAETFQSLNPTRLCPLGQTQHPPLTWHQDHYPPLASLTTWQPTVA